MFNMAFRHLSYPDGIEIVEGPPPNESLITLGLPKPDFRPRHFRPRTDRTKTEQRVAADLENPLIVAFANASGDKALCQFFARYGLLSQFFTPFDFVSGFGEFLLSGREQGGVSAFPPMMQEQLILDAQDQYRHLLQ